MAASRRFHRQNFHIVGILLRPFSRGDDEEEGDTLAPPFSDVSPSPSRRSSVGQMEIDEERELLLDNTTLSPWLSSRRHHLADAHPGINIKISFNKSPSHGSPFTSPNTGKTFHVPLHDARSTVEKHIWDEN